MDRDEVVKFQKLSASVFTCRYFCKTLQHCETGQYIYMRLQTRKSH